MICQKPKMVIILEFHFFLRFRLRVHQTLVKMADNAPQKMEELTTPVLVHLLISMERIVSIKVRQYIFGNIVIPINTQSISIKTSYAHGT